MNETTTEAAPVMTGMITGGWEYINFAYGFSFSCLILYFIYTTVRMRSVREETG